MSSGTKRAAIQKANRLRKRLALLEHQFEVMKSFAEEVSKLVQAQQDEIDRLMLEYCPDEVTPGQLELWVSSQLAYLDGPVHKDTRI